MYLELAESIYGNDHTEPTSSGEVQFNCPYCINIRHKADHDHKLYLNIYSGLYYCFKCGSRGKLLPDESARSSNKSKLYKLLADDTNEVAPSELFLLPNQLARYNELTYNYLRSRGLTEEDMDYYSIRAGSLLDNLYTGRVVIPNHIIRVGADFTDMLVARSIDPKVDKRWKYLNPKGSNKSRSVFNLHRIPENPSRIIITEGVFSSISAGRDAVATYGKLVSDDQIRMIIAKNPKRVYVMLDHDAEHQAVALATQLNQVLPDVYYVKLEDDRDPSDLGYEMTQRVIENQSIKISRLSKLII